jgi:hypothetical protein
MSMFDRRVQLLLDRDRYERISREAGRRGVSVATVIREAIDQAVPAGDERRARAGRRILDAPDMSLPDIDGLRRELDEIRSGR